MDPKARTCSARTAARLRVVLAALAGLLLAGCNVVLYSDLNETDVNEIVAVLARHDIDRSKRQGRGGTVSVEVSKVDVAAAVDVLRQSGLPRKRFDNMGALFSKQGLISSPLEERARFVYAMQETLQETLSQIDGVIVARVHVVLPENNPFGNDGKEASSASVFIKHSPDFDLGSLRSEIKMVVGNGIAGLTYKDVTVTLVAAAVRAGTEPAAVAALARKSAGVGIPATQLGTWALLVIGLAWLVSAVVGRRAKPSSLPEVREDDAAEVSSPSA